MTSAATSNGIVTTYQQQPRQQRYDRRPTIPELLMARQQGGRVPTQQQLASRIAWNPSRMRNMTLCVGPGTPADVCKLSDDSSDNDDDSSNEHRGDEDEDVEEDDSENFSDDEDHDYYDDDDDKEQEEGLVNSDDDLEGEDEQLEYDDAEVVRRRRNRAGATRSLEHAERAFMDWLEADGNNNDDESSEDEYAYRHQSGRQQQQQQRYVTSLHHGGCINTAAWLTSPWRVSTTTCNNGSRHHDDEYTTLPSDDCPTQLITSGDDRKVKFWDVRHAMGTSNPLAGGKNTVCPFSSEVPHEPPIDAWKDFHSKSVVALSGSVVPLAAVYTRHRGNVFHVTPLDHEPGKVVTCGADGFLRCSDVTSQTSTIIISPEYGDADDNSMSLRPGMCFSHHFVDANTGLLCSERGLRRFDIRVNPREQQMRSVLSSDTCKACAVWSKGSEESAYVFAGGASADVAMYDLRMVSDGGPQSRKVQLYRPRGLSEDAQVSVSGIDISKNKKELLVSYENDQIYSFPICPGSGAAGPTVDELTEMSDKMEEEETVQNELCAYGGHLNRYTFLKNAKYAGPNDEYICTGSDSGHAWIYNKYDGSVVSFLNADHSTCNGVVPHPTLPLFLTYGIDSTAKLWRATTPVDSEVDDSPTGRSRFYYENKNYHRTPLVSSWTYCKEKLSILSDVDDDDTICVMPDEIPSTADMCDRGLFGGFSSIFFRNRRSGNPGQRTTYIGNDLGNLTGVLRQNLFSCILAHESDDDEPIRSGLDELKRRMSVIRLNHQATRKGLIVDQDIKWQLRAAQWHSPLPPTTADYKLHSLVKYGDPVDLIPESPCDWIPYDPEMTGNNIDCGLNFNLDDYEEFYWQYYSRPNAIGATETEDADSEAKSSATESLHGNKRKLDSEQTGEPIIVANGSAESKVTIQPCTADVAATTVTVTPDKSGTGSLVSKSSLSSDEEDSADAIIAAAEAAIEAAGTSKAAQTFHSLKVLHDTVSMLKEAGNQAQKAGLPGLAARRYDQAIQYCSVVFLEFPRGNLDIFAARNTAIAVSDGASNVGRIEWSPLLKLLIETRLNLSVVLLKLECDPEPKKAADLAMTALFELGPFVVERGHIRKGHKYSEIHSSKEPHSTYRVAKELQAKAYFRLGSAQQEMRNHEDAVKSFEHSIKSTKAIGKKPETVVLRRLAEAKRLKARKNKSQRKKLKAMFGGGGDEEKTADAKFGVASATTDEKTTEEEGKDDE